MRKALFLNLVLIVGCFVIFGSVPAVQADDAAPAAKVDKLFEKWNSADSPGAAVAIIKDGMVVYRKGFGSAQLEYSIPITPSTVFHVASVSKQFTAMAITMLEAAGKLSADDDIRKYLPEMADFGKTITIRNLLHHTSGLRDQWELLILSGWRMDDVITQADIMDRLKRQRELNFAPGERYLLLQLRIHAPRRDRGSGERPALYPMDPGKYLRAAGDDLDPFPSGLPRDRQEPGLFLSRGSGKGIRTKRPQLRQRRGHQPFSPPWKTWPTGCATSKTSGSAAPPSWTGC